MMRAGGGSDRHLEAYRLGDWEVRPSLNRIRRNGQERLMEPKVMRVLQELAARAPEVVPRTVLMERVWPQEYVTEHVLSRCISELRKALDDEAAAPRYVETIRKGGYRLMLLPQAAIDAAPSGGPDRLQPSSEAAKPAGYRRLPALAATAASLALAALLVSRLGEPPRADDLRRSLPLTSYPGSEVDPVLSPDGRHLAFSWDAGEGNFDIYWTSLGASTAHRLTSHPGEDKNPVYLPDGKRIAFVRAAPGEEGIYAVRWEEGNDSDGPAASEELLIACNTGDIPDLAVSPQGRYLYFSDLPDHGRPPSAIYRLDLRSGEKRAMTRPPEYAFGDRDLTLSHDGRRLAFARAEMPGVEELFVLDLESGRSLQLTAENESIAGMTWTPDDSGIVFASSRDLHNLLWVVPADASARPRAVASLGTQLHDPFMTASGELVVEHKQFESNLWIGRALDDQLELIGPLAPSTRWDMVPAVASDGQVAFVSTRSGFPALWICDPSGSRLQRLTDPSLLPTRSAWSPDGRSLVFSDRSRGQADLMQVSASGGPTSRLTDTPYNEVAPVFSHDGRWIYFGSNRDGRWQLMRVAVPDPGAPLDWTGVEVAASGGAIRGLESSDGRFLYFARHSRPGLWRKPLPDGPEVLVSSGPAAGGWSEWALQGDALHYVEHRGEESLLHSLRIRGAAFSPLPERMSPLSVPRRLYVGGGIAVAPDGHLYLVGLDRTESDILLTQWVP